ncbi:MotA/TolQ/ExbB proton channel family protein [Pelagicoccus sp. SDUM812005]|uniref:MotA/TolQ/ExbB proton channel family protein n=1 Tax=Pelagicoccus sp. SDUM812005 TaxID=3041257 RepID=UPI00280F851C|nr:MotA/TolQ/ExbB proton channel family protein [Pelagicoccus sp. SDUM812005]MDQ8181239.1 MotA/TolQ/ExbB proton channel family protein [Pelagicoccus sp. SDUM812005]
MDCRTFFRSCLLSHPSRVLAIVVLALPDWGVAQETSQISEEMKSLVRSSLDAYRQLESEIAQEKTPLVTRMSRLEEGNLQLRAKLESYRFLSERIATEIGELNEEGKSLQDQVGYVRSASETFLSKFESRINLSESQRYFDQLESIRAQAASEEPLVRQFAAFAEALQLSLERSEAILGGDRFAGKAIGEQGSIHRGQVVVWGPSGFFLDEDGERAGALSYHSDAIEPGVSFLDATYAGNLASFVKTGEGTVPLDPTLGDALALEQSQGDVFTHLRRGGLVGYVILALGIVAGLVSLLKIRDLKGFSTPSAEEIAELSRLAREGGSDQAITKATKIRGVAGDVMATGIRNMRKNALLLEETMLSVVLRAKPRMERYLPFLAITAAASPLLGLLGTVVGLIKTFALITLYGAGAPNALSAGISEALITTELGLIVAIPTLILHGLFSRLIRSRIVALEQVAFDFVETTNLELAEAK